MDWITVLVAVVIVTAVVGVSSFAWQTKKVRKWQAPGGEVITVPPRYDTEWDALVAKRGDPADIATTGPEFALPKAD